MDRHPALNVTGVSKSFNGKRVLTKADLTLQKNGLLAVLGPTGSGKTTLLRIIAGLEDPSEGEVNIDGKTVSCPGFSLAAHKRGIGMVFQDLALWPHMSVRENVVFGSRADPAFVKRILDMTHLEALAGRMPSTLSGGQRQCVALARALACAPEILLLDEPFTNLDWKIKQGLFCLIKDLVAELGISAVFVTHDPVEAASLADSFAILDEGQIVSYPSLHALIQKSHGWFLPEMAKNIALSEGLNKIADEHG
jgi:ABC-type Fe3+/spermidine/putrescine transport system ATPase subunit